MVSAEFSKHPFVLKATVVGRVHTYFAASAFLSALFIGIFLHYKKIVKNDVAGYPDEWFPSVSATIGDWYPERNIFQILIALTAGPRFALVALQYYLHRSQSAIPTLVFVFGLIRTVSCGGWVFITSSDDHDVHDVMMITYMVCNIPWMIGGITSTPMKSTSVRRKRKYISTAFFATILPLIYFFIQHKVHRIPGAYTRYAFFEWGLIFFDVLYDSVAEQEFSEAGLQITIGSLVSCPPTVNPDQIVNNILVPEKLNDDGALKTADKALTDAANAALAPATSGSTAWSKKLAFLSEYRQPISFISDVYLSYIFWSILTSLIPTLFYFSVWELGIAGHELALLSTLSPILFSIPPYLRWARTRNGQITLHLLSFVGLAAYLLAKPADRLFVVAFANVILVMRQVAQWAGAEGATMDSGYEAVLTSSGLLLSSLSKHANHTNNPVWPFINETCGGYNKTGLFLAFLATMELYTRSLAPSETMQSFKSSKAVSSPLSKNWLSAAIPLGSLLFSLHNLLAEPSTLIAWSWTGYENRVPKGPVSHLHGSLTLIAQALGILVFLVVAPKSTAAPRTNPLAHPLWFLYGSASAYVMYKYRDWLGYIGGLNHAIFLMSIIPLVLQMAASSGRVARTYTTAFFVYCLLNLASIFTAAYAFVPGGVIFRERTDLVMIAQLACLSSAFRFPIFKNIIASHTIYGNTKAYSKTLLAVFSVLSVLVTMYRSPNAPPTPFKAGPRIITAGIWTVHFGFDNEGHDSQRGMRNLIRDMQLDIVGLLETDLHRTAFGHRDLTRVIVEEGYYVDIGPGPNSHTWGCVLLTKFPIINTTHHLLPSPHGELAPAIEAILDIYGTEVTVVVAHNGQEEDALDRELQSTELARIMSSSNPRPLIFLGYVVTKPHANRPAPYEIMVTDGKVHDIDADDLDRWCEYIFYRGLYRTAYARISRGIITDTEMQIGQFVLPKHNEAVTDESVPARYARAFKEDLPVEHWFPDEYYGNENEGGVDGHFYHVFNTPLYYKIPENANIERD